ENCLNKKNICTKKLLGVSSGTITLRFEWCLNEKNTNDNEFNDITLSGASKSLNNSDKIETTDSNIERNNSSSVQTSIYKISTMYNIIETKEDCLLGNVYELENNVTNNNNTNDSNNKIKEECVEDYHSKLYNKFKNKTIKEETIKKY